MCKKSPPKLRRASRGSRHVMRSRSWGRLAQLVGDIRKRRIGVGTNRLNGGQTHNDNQGQHHSVLNCRGAVFRNEESLDLLSETLHGFLQILDGPPTQLECSGGQKTSFEKVTSPFPRTSDLVPSPSRRRGTPFRQPGYRGARRPRPFSFARPVFRRICLYRGCGLGNNRDHR